MLPTTSGCKKTHRIRMSLQHVPVPNAFCRIPRAAPQIGCRATCFRLKMMMLLLPTVDSSGSLAPSQAAFSCRGLVESGRLQAADFPRLHNRLAGQRYRDRRVGPNGMSARKNGSITAATAAAAEASAIASRRNTQQDLAGTTTVGDHAGEDHQQTSCSPYILQATSDTLRSFGQDHDTQRGVVCVHCVDAIR